MLNLIPCLSLCPQLCELNSSFVCADDLSFWFQALRPGSAILLFVCGDPLLVSRAF